MSRFVKTESGRIFRLPAAELAELVDGVWVAPVAPVFGGTLMEAEPISEEEVLNLLKEE